MEVAGENHSATHQDLAVLRHAHLVAGEDLTDRPDAHATGAVDAGHASVLALTVHLADAQSDGREKAQHFGVDRRRAAGEDARVGEPERSTQSGEHQPVGQAVTAAQAGGDGRARLVQVGHAATGADRPPRQCAARRGAAIDPPADHHSHLLPHTGHAEEMGGSHLT